MRFAPAFVIFSAALCSAGTITDTFHQTQNSSAPGGCDPNAPYTASTACDVFGDEMKFDVQSATVTVAGGVGTVTLYSNLGGVTSPLANFTVGNTTLKPGDLFLYDPSDNGTISNFVNDKSHRHRHGFRQWQHRDRRERPDVRHPAGEP